MKKKNSRWWLKDGKYGYIHKSGKMVVQPVYNDAYGFDGGYAVVNLEGKYGLIQSNGNIKLPPRYDDLSSLGPLEQLLVGRTEWKIRGNKC